MTNELPLIQRQLLARQLLRDSAPQQATTRLLRDLARQSQIEVWDQVPIPLCTAVYLETTVTRDSMLLLFPVDAEKKRQQGVEFAEYSIFRTSTSIKKSCVSARSPVYGMPMIHFVPVAPSSSSSSKHATVFRPLAMAVFKLQVRWYSSRPSAL